jgi:DNA-binding response OmpR family regulator
VGLSILLVDDDPDFADILAEALEEEGHEVVIAREGAAAASLASAMIPDVVLLDLGLPDIDGYDVARTLRKGLPVTTPIIVVTGERHAADGGDFDLMLTKPISFELFGGLMEYMRRRRLHLINGAT